jgi:hypothetical protein
VAQAIYDLLYLSPMAEYALGTLYTLSPIIHSCVEVSHPLPLLNSPPSFLCKNGYREFTDNFNFAGTANATAEGDRPAASVHRETSLRL